MRHRTALGAVAIACGPVVGMSAPATGASAPAAPVSPVPADRPDPRQVAAAAADRLITAKPAPFRRSAKDRILRRGVQSGAGGLQHVVYDRTYAGLPVHGGDFVVVTDKDGAVLGASVNQTRALSVSTRPKISADAAAKTARALLSKVGETSEPRLTVIAEGRGRLAYEVVVTGTKGTRPSLLHVLVDARTGEVAQSWDEVRDADDQSYYHGGRQNPIEIATTGSGGQYSMRDPGRPGVSCANQSGTVYSGTDDVWGNAGGTSLETACVDAMHAAAKETDMVGAWLGRNGLNGSGRGWPMRVGLNQANAYWNGSYANFGRNSASTRQATPTDVVAHELGHGIFQNTPGGSGGSNEKGGLNESAGDIFGALTEWYANEPRVSEQLSGTTAVVNHDPPDYLVGEEVDLVGDGPIRNMYNPSALGDPNCYSSSVPSMEVHAAAGVQNHWFYLLAEGSNAGDPNNGRPNSPTCNGSTVTGVGVQKAGLIFMEMLNLKTTTWTHSLARGASLRGVLNLVQVGKATCADFTRTRDAWNAVSVPAAGGEPTSCTGGGSDFSLGLSPSSASAQPGQSVTATVSTQTTSGSAQQVTLSATSRPSGPTASFSPGTVTSGQSSTMTVNVPAGTPDGTYTLTVLADGAQVDRTAAFTLTVGSGGSGEVFADDFETDKGWTGDPNGSDTATTGRLQRGTPQTTSSSGTNLQLAAATGNYDLVTGASAGTSAGTHDLDGGTTTIQSPAITLPADGTLTLTFSWYLAHLNNATSADYLRVRIAGTTTTTALDQTGSATNRAGTWQTATVDISAHTGQTVRILIDAADAATASLIEAGIDNIKITRS